MSFVVTQRTREIGIRLALGVTRGSAIWLVLRDALVMITVGTAIALPCVAALGRLVESQLFGLKPTDPLAIAAATLLLTSAALGAALIPAYRASTVNPADALRFDEHKIGIKATTNEHLGFVGREEGIAAMAVASIFLPD